MNILIAIEGCKAHEDRFPVITETWGQHAIGNPGVHLRFFTGPLLGVADDYLSLPQKTRAICRYADDLDYDYLLMADTDAYISLPRALASGFENYDYSGFVQTWLTTPPYCSGPSYWLSKRAIGILAETYWPSFDVPGHSTDEDVMVGSVLFHRGIRYHHDDRYVSQIPVLPTNNVISEHLSFTGPYTHEKMYEAHRNATGNHHG